MAVAKVSEAQAPACPFVTASVEAAKRVFLMNPAWKRVYDAAPPGAKRRLEVSFWFSKNNLAGNDDDDHDERFEKYCAWRNDVERAMTEEDILYMYKAIDKPATRKHFASLLKGRRAHSHDGGIRLMPYDDFFAMLDEHGEFRSFDYPDATKEAIVADFLPVLLGSGDPLATHIEDILATAKVKDIRVYPQDEIMYVRVEVRFLTETAEWSTPYQMLAAWDSFNDLKGYVFPVGKGHRSELPIELENPENEMQREKRMQLMVARIAAEKDCRQGKEGRQ